MDVARADRQKRPRVIGIEDEVWPESLDHPSGQEVRDKHFGAVRARDTRPRQQRRQRVAQSGEPEGTPYVRIVESETDDDRLFPEIVEQADELGQAPCSPLESDPILDDQAAHDFSSVLAGEQTVTSSPYARDRTTFDRQRA